MQAKRFARNVEETIAAGGVFSIEIENTNNRRANWHGIRWQGKLRADNVSADGEAHGLLVLFCRSGQFGSLTEPFFDSDSDLEKLSEAIVAVIPWSVFGGSTNPVGANTYQEWSLDIKTSRTCARGGVLEGTIVSMSESSKSIIVSNQLLSAFETTV